MKKNPKIIKLHGNLKSPNFSASNRGYLHIIYCSHNQICKLIYKHLKLLIPKKKMTVLFIQLTV